MNPHKACVNKQLKATKKQHKTTDLESNTKQTTITTKIEYIALIYLIKTNRESNR